MADQPTNKSIGSSADIKSGERVKTNEAVAKTTKKTKNDNHYQINSDRKEYRDRKE